MSSELFFFDGFPPSSSFYHHPSPDLVPADHPLSVFCDSTLLQSITTSQLPPQNPVDEPSTGYDPLAPPPVILSSSPPSHQFENLSLTQMQNQPNCGLSLPNGYENLADLCGMDIKSEQSFDGYGQQSFLPHSYSGVENVEKYMQRSLSSSSSGIGGFRTRFDALMEPQNLCNTQVLSSPENSFFLGQMRRVCSTGDLQNVRKSHASQGSYSSPLAADSSLSEETNFKVGRYSAEERKERISKYRAKRTQRNFNKTIKYACRKTLADNRPRIRGRFARNDEVGELPKAACCARDDEDDDLWLVDGLHEEEEEGRGNREGFANSFGQAPFQYYYGGCS